jgi:hypothetical protein
MVSKSLKLRFGVCHERSNECKFVMGNPLIGGFVETQHETKKSGVERQND